MKSQNEILLEKLVKAQESYINLLEDDLQSAADTASNAEVSSSQREDGKVKDELKLS